MIQILDNGLSFDANGNFHYAWFKIQKDARTFFRCVALRELAVIPVTDREKYDLLGKQWGALRGLHNAGVNFVYAAMGIYKPEHVGIVQYYGAAGEGEDESAAAEKALTGASAVSAVLANFPQSKLASPNSDWLRWYLEFVTSKSKYIAAILGHPDPRQGHKGSSADGSSADDGDTDLASEQNEILFRGLSKLSQNFVYQILAEHIQRPVMSSALVRIAEIASNVASRRKGAIGFGFNLSIPLMAALGQTQSAGVSAIEGQSQSVSEGASHGWGVSHARGESFSETNTHTVGRSESWGESQGTNEGVANSKGSSHTETESHSTMSSSTRGRSNSETSGGGWSQTDTVSGSVNLGQSIIGKIPLIGSLVQGVSIGAGQANGVSGFSSSGVTTMSSSTSGESHGHAVSRGTMESETISKGTSEGKSHTISHSESNSHSVTRGRSESWGESESWGKSYAEGRSVTDAFGRSSAQGVIGALSTGLLPGISINRSYITEDDVAERLTEVLRRLESVVNQASLEGGYMTNAWIFTDSDAGSQAADALVPQAFHGTSVPTPVMTIRPEESDEGLLRAHAFSFTPWTNIDEGDPFGGLMWTRYATLITASQLAAYTAPGLFEEGIASTVMAEIPKGMGFDPAMRGDVVVGHQYSPETAELTTAQVRLSPESLMHTMAAGDTGFGKSVAMIRMAYETTLRWKLRSVVLDFGAGWRQLLNAPGLEGRVNILQLWPDAVRPMRWNPLQIGRNISPETQWRAFADVFGGIAQLGVKRQKQELLEALRKVYLREGVLVDDPDNEKPVVDRSEASVIGVKPGLNVSDLPSRQKQELAVYRSSKIGLSHLYDEVSNKLAKANPRDTTLQGVLEGIIFRLNPLVQGTAKRQFAPGPDVIPVEDLSKPWGITIIEGGMFLDDFGKAFLLGWTGWHLYMDMVARRVHEVNLDEPILQIFYEEANKIFVKDSGGGDESGGVSATQRFADMFRDARKYKARLHVISQAPHLIADDIVSSCSNMLVTFIKDSKDKDIVLSALARSEKGFRDEEWRRFIDDIPIGMTIGRFPYTQDRTKQRPFLFRPLMLDVPEPADAEIEEKLGGIRI
jgi:hypothetical protein